LGHLLHDFTVVLTPVGTQATRTILDSLLRVGKAAAALVFQSIQGAIAEQAAEILRVRALMAGEIFTFPVLKIIEVGHYFPPKILFNPTFSCYTIQRKGGIL
jgi:hypothetical protein